MSPLSNAQLLDAASLGTHAGRRNVKLMQKGSQTGVISILEASAEAVELGNNVM